MELCIIKFYYKLVSNVKKVGKIYRSNTTLMRIELNKTIRMGVFYMKNISIEERAVKLAHYIIDSKDTVRGAAKKFGISKSTVHKDVTLKNGWKLGQVIPESIEIKKVFLAEKNPIVKIGLIVK